MIVRPVTDLGIEIRAGLHTGEVATGGGRRWICRSTGNSSGPHNHLEWHPENGPAVDPYEYLMLVCSAPL